MSMEYTFLGKSGLRVSRICLGCMTFGDNGNGAKSCDEAESHAVLDRFLELGGNFIDTANVYAAGQSEAYIGSWLKKNPEKRSSLIIATKTRFPMSKTDVNAGGLSRKHIVDSVNASLARLQTDYIDVLQMHCWDDGTPIEETLGTVGDLIRSGKIHYFGVSNVTGWQLQKIVDTAARMGLPPIVSLQAQYSLLCRWTEWELQAVCKNEGLALMPWSPLKGGWLTGKITRDKAPEDSRVAWAESTGSKLQSAPGFSSFSKDESVWTLLDTLSAIAKETSRSVPQVSLKWLLQKPRVDTVVIGARTLAQLEDNCGAGQAWELSQEQMKRLDDCSAPSVPYPYEMVWRCQAGRQHAA